MANGAPQRQSGAEPSADAGGVHVIRLQRVDGVHTDLHQVAHDRLEVTVAVVEDAEVGLGGPRRLDDRRQARLEEFAPGGRADDHRPRHPHVVVEGQHVHAGTGQRLGVAAGQVGQPVEEKVGPGRPLDQVYEKVLQAAQPPGGLEQFAAQVGQVAASGQAAGLQSLHLAGQPLGVIGRANIGERKAAQVVQRTGPGQGAAVLRGFRAVVPTGVGCHLSRAAQPRVWGKRAGQTIQGLLLRRKRELDKAHIHRAVPVLARRGQALEVHVVKAQCARDAIRFAAVKRGQQSLASVH